MIWYYLGGVTINHVSEIPDECFAVLAHITCTLCRQFFTRLFLNNDSVEKKCQDIQNNPGHQNEYDNAEQFTHVLQ